MARQPLKIRYTRRDKLEELLQKLFPGKWDIEVRFVVTLMLTCSHQSEEW